MWFESSPGNERFHNEGTSDPGRRTFLRQKALDKNAMQTSRSRYRSLRWIAVLSLTAFSACCKNVPQAKGMDAFKSASAVTLRCPAEATSQGPILIDVSLDADARTYWDNQGVIDEALQILLVRRDRPGLLFVAKSDPAAMMLPSPPLSGRPSEEELARAKDRVSQKSSYDVLAYGRQHRGAAEYFVIAAFADAWAGPARLRVVDPNGPMAPEQREVDLTQATAWNEPIPAARGVIVRTGEMAGYPAVLGAFRTSAPKNDGVAPFATIVLSRLGPKGGTLQRQFRLAYRQDREDVVGGFAVPISALDPLNPTIGSGRYAVFAFVGEESATASLVQIP
jgi:hypothetical protein